MSEFYVDLLLISICNEPGNARSLIQGTLLVSSKKFRLRTVDKAVFLLHFSSYTLPVSVVSLVVIVREASE